MVRKKQSLPTPNRNSSESPANMNETTKCSQCDLVVNRKGENRPGITCRDCQKEHCNTCAKLTIDFCTMMKKAKKQLWQCPSCETKDNDIKSVLVSIRDEMKTLKQGQEEQQAERAQVLKGLKMMETVARKVEAVETAQASLETKVDGHEAVLNQQGGKIKENDARLTQLEDRIKKVDSEAINIRQVNAAVRELREVEKRGRNFIIYNVPESTADTSEQRKTFDEGKVKEILLDLKITDIQPKNVIRVGVKNGKYPRMILVVLSAITDCERILKSVEVTQLKGDIAIGRDRTYNQRMEARQYRLDKEKEEKGAEVATAARGRGRGRPPRGQGSLRGRGTRNVSMKRRRSQSEEGSKRRRTGGTDSKEPANSVEDHLQPDPHTAETPASVETSATVGKQSNTPTPPTGMTTANGHQGSDSNMNF